MSYDELLVTIILIVPIFAMIYTIVKCNIYLIYGFVSLKKILLEIDVKSRFKVIVKYVLFWSLILLLTMYLIALYIVLKTSWWEI